jgi:hypothetical protein
VFSESSNMQLVGAYGLVTHYDSDTETAVVGLSETSVVFSLLKHSIIIIIIII